MTYREKLKFEYPEKVNRRYIGGCKGCPRDYGYEGEYNLPDCSFENCKECWDREIPGSEALSCSETPNSSDLISRQAAIDALDKRFDNITMEQRAEFLKLRKDLRELPTIQPERKKGEWLPDNNYAYEMRFVCSCCKESEIVPTIGFTKNRPLWDFCPNCGAKMEGME